MMSSRNGRESLFGARNFPVGSLQHHRRGQSLNGISKDSDENLDLFSKNRRTPSVASSDESSDVSVKLGRLSVGSAQLARSGINDLLSSTDGGKHDYDWLLTPPGTPVFPSSEGESQPTLVPPRNSSVRSTSTTKASRLSVSQSENSHSRAARSSSVTRPSISSSQYTSYSSNRSSSSILNTSSASVSSYTRPSSPITRSPASARPSTPSSRPTPSRPSTPSRVRSVSTSPSVDKSRPSQSSRPSTPSSRPQIPANLHSPSVPSSRSLSRSSTPTRRNSMPSPSSTTASPSVSVNGRNSAPSSRPSSPGPRIRPPPQPIVPPDFPLETPPNLRTTLPDRPVSAGRSRPGVASTLKGSKEPPASVNIPRRQSSPIVTRGRLTEAAGRSRGHANSHHVDVPEPRKVPDVVTRKSVKASTTATDSSGFGRNISKRSLDMAIRHMDIRNSSGNLRSLSSTTLFPQSIRTSTPKTQSTRGFSAPASVDMNGSPQSSNNGATFDSRNDVKRNIYNGTEGDERERQYFSKLSEVDFCESSRYDAILLKEDLKNTNWLHSADDKCDQGPIFDNGFEPLPEPFGLL